MSNEPTPNISSQLNLSHLPPEEQARVRAMIDSVKIAPEFNPLNPRLDEEYEPIGSTYYKEDKAKSILPVLDGMIKDRQDRMFLREKFNLTHQTLKLYILHAWKYTRKYLDPDGSYTNLFKETEVKIETVGVSIRFGRRIESMVDTIPPLPDEEKLSRAAEPPPKKGEIATPKWWNEARDWLTASQSGDVYEKKKVNITERDEKFLDGLLKPLGEMVILKLLKDVGTVVIVRV